jgi:hypothetical protein
MALFTGRKVPLTLPTFDDSVPHQSYGSNLGTSFRAGGPSHVSILLFSRGGGRSVSFLRTASLCLIAIASLTSISAGQTYCPSAGNGSSVLTWHNDTNRTGWQCNEATLTQSNVTATTNGTTGFGLIAQWTVSGSVYAQPLAANGVPAAYCAPGLCDVVYIATENDYVYAFSPAGADAWAPTFAPAAGGVSLVSLLNNGDTAVNCVPATGYTPPTLCGAPVQPKNHTIGVTGTPAIDPSTSTLYVVGAFQQSGGVAISYYLFAMNYGTGALQAAPLEIAGGVTYGNPMLSTKCNPNYNNQTGISFNASGSLQRQALLLEPNPANGNEHWLYVTFSDYPEVYMGNGWVFAYYLSNQASAGYPNTLTQKFVAAPTPYSGEGGFWGSGSGPAADQTSGPVTGSIFETIGNGGFDANQGSDNQDWGDSLVRLSPTSTPTALWPPADYYTPGNVSTYPGSLEPGLCINDEDFGSGGVLVVPSGYTYECTGAGCTQCTTQPYCNVVISADKQSYIYVENQANLGKYMGSPTGSQACASPPNNIECVQTPSGGDTTQGYWASPAYWYDGGSGCNGTGCNWIFYSATNGNYDVSPLPLAGYQLTTSGNIPANDSPVPQTPSAKSWSGSLQVGFCQYSPTPTVSSGFNTDGTVNSSSGIVWTIADPYGENPSGTGGSCQGTDNGTQAGLYAFCATTQSGTPCANQSQQLTELYNCSLALNGVSGIPNLGHQVPFSTPTVYNGQVYVGTFTAVDVFGLCSNAPSGACLGTYQQ